MPGLFHDASGKRYIYTRVYTLWKLRGGVALLRMTWACQRGHLCGFRKSLRAGSVLLNIACSNRFSSLVDEDVYVGGELNIDVVRQEACEVKRVRFARKLKIATWNFAGLCSERKQKEISEVLNRVKVDIHSSWSGDVGEEG